MLQTDSRIFEEINLELNDLPSKLNFRIGEVAKILKVKPHVLRYWECEFPLLKPKKFINNQRLYTKKDMEILFLIKNLLYEEKFTIKGVRKHLTKFYGQFKKIKNNMRGCKPVNKTVKKDIKNLLKEISSFRSQFDQDKFL